jgi:hypothetical protein
MDKLSFSSKILHRVDCIGTFEQGNRTLARLHPPTTHWGLIYYRNAQSAWEFL